MKASTSAKPLEASRILILALFAGLAGLALARGFGEVTDWVFTHFLFSHEHEFLKRALVGEMLQRIGGDVDYQTVFLVSTVALILLATLLFLVFIRPYLKTSLSSGTLLFAAVAITSPASLQHFAFDLGRFDALNLIFALLSIFAIQRLPRLTASLVVYTLLLVSLLVHEAAFFIYVPMILAYWFYHDRSMDALLLQLLFGLLAVGLTFVISRWGLATLYSLDQHIDMLTESYGVRVKHNSVKVLHRGGVIENIRYTYWVGMTMERLWHHLSMLAILSPLFFLLFLTIRSLIMNTEGRPFRLLMVLYASISPLALYPLGQDHFRWWALALTNLLILLAVLAAESPEICKKIAPVFEKHSTICWLTIGVGLVVGPLGVTEPFPN